jgi:hypothetical protein
MVLAVVTVLLLVQTVFGLQWYAQYDLSQSHIDFLKNQHCYRGLYGGGVNVTSPRTLSLLTCPAHTTLSQEPFAATDDDAFLCVVELKPNTSIEFAEAVVTRLGAKVLFHGRQELVLANPLVPSELHTACFVDHVDDIADNVILVPRDPVLPTRPLPEDHPVLQRFGPGKVAAPNARITDLLSNMQQSNIQSQDVQLSTDFAGATGTGSKITRNSYAIGSKCLSGWKCPRDTITYITNQVNNLFRSYTPAIKVETQSFRADMCENLIVTIPGLLNANRFVIVGAHLDSRMALESRTDAPAPGGDDNASGAAVLLEYARVIAANNYKFDYSIQLQWYCGEEQGLYGSAAIAKNYQATGVSVIGMFNIDMIGWVYQPTGSPPKSTLAWTIGPTNTALTQRCRDASTLYNPTQPMGDSRGCCSDEQSFSNYGFQTVAIFETPTTNIQYPYYHKETDVASQVNFPQVFSFAKSFMACIAEHAVIRP